MQPIAFYKGRPIWPMMGAEDDPPKPKPNDPPPADDDNDDDDTDWKAEARKWEKRAKANSTAATEGAKAAARLKELQDKDLPELEKWKGRAEEAERKLADIEPRLLRAEVAAEKGLTGSLAKRLVGATREELEADADELLKDFGGKNGKDGKGDEEPDKGDNLRRRPEERLKSGAAPSTEPVETDPAKLAAKIPRMYS